MERRVLMVEKMNEYIEKQKKKTEEKRVTIYLKRQLTVEEAAEYSGIGQRKIRELAKREDADFTLHCGRKLLIKRKRFDDYIDHELVI